MREYSIELSRMLSGGIRNTARLDFSKERANLLDNLVPSVEGVKNREPIVNPFSGVSLSHPFPQFFKGMYQWLLCTENSVYFVDKDDFSLTLVNVVDSTTYLPSAITPGGRWHFVDLHNSWFLFNGQSVVWSGDYEPITDGSSFANVYVNNSFRINTACLHKGRIVFGGFDPDNQWSSAQIDAFTTMATGFTVFPNTVYPRFEHNFVAWTSIGDGSFLRNLLIGDNIEIGPFNAQTGTNWNQWLVEALQRGDFGFMAMPFSGSVQALVPAGDGVMVYGTNGVAYMNEVSANELFTGGYGVTGINHVGVYDRGSAVEVGGQHVFVGSDLALYTFNTKEGLQYLDYKDVIGSGVIADDCAMTVDERERQVYITFFNSAYIYTPGLGLAKSGRRVSFVERIAGDTLYGVFSNDDTALRVVTNSFDMDSSAIKTLTLVNLGMNLAAGQTISVAVDYRYRRGDAYTRTPFTPVNKEGNAFVRVSGLDFRIVIVGTLDVQTDINFIEVRYQQSDKRYRRGPSDLANAT